MADATLQILGLGQGFVPLGYNVTGDQSMDLVAVKADFDGTTAGTDFVPMVQIISPAGEIMAESQGSTVTAGDSATVSFAPFLRAAATSGAGGITATNARYGATTLTVNANQSGTFSLTGPSFGPAIFDLTTPTAPTIVTAGVYQFSCVFRIVFALGGQPTAGSGHAGAINGAGGGQNCSAFFTMPSAAGTWVPQWTATSVAAQLNAGDVVTFRPSNGDNASSRVYDSPSIAVSLLT